jgi:hypothetical protein
LAKWSQQKKEMGLFVDFQTINQNGSKKYWGKVWKIVEQTTKVVSLQPVLA